MLTPLDLRHEGCGGVVQQLPGYYVCEGCGVVPTREVERPVPLPPVFQGRAPDLFDAPERREGGAHG